MRAKERGKERVDLRGSQHLAAKKKDAIFTADMTPLLAHGQAWDFDAAFDRVWNELIARLPGEPSKGA